MNKEWITHYLKDQFRFSKLVSSFTWMKQDLLFLIQTLTVHQQATQLSNVQFNPYIKLVTLKTDLMRMRTPIFYGIIPMETLKLFWTHLSET